MDDHLALALYMHGDMWLFQRKTISLELSTPLTLAKTTSPLASFSDVLAQFSLVIKKIYEQGGRSFWMHNTGPVGCLAYMLDCYPMNVAQMDKYGCATPFNEVAQYFNQRLKEAVVKLREDLPAAAITYVDIYTVKYTLISQAKKYNFEKPLIACCGQGRKYSAEQNQGRNARIRVCL